MLKIALDSLGCKLNQAETEQLARQLAVAGYRVVSSAAEADIYLLNTCTVTHTADRKSRQLLRRAHRENPGAKLVATGCLAERAPGELGKISGVELVVGNADKSQLLGLLKSAGLAELKLSAPPPQSGKLRTRAFIKIQDGCNSRCAYCIVPQVRGEESSLSADGVLGEINNRLVTGCREVVLTGVKIGAYDDGGISLAGLVERILSETTIERLRLSSLQPKDVTPELLRLFADKRLCPHFHLCLQSGCEATLRRMRRGYSLEDYAAVVSRIREQIPGVAITTDVIVGFPGETEAEFAASLDFCRRMDFARIHVFSYSPRQDTEAAQLPGQVKEVVKKERSRRTLKLAEEAAASFRQRFVGQTMAVLFEQMDDGFWTGYTGNYIKVYFKSDENLTDKILSVKMGEVLQDGVRGELANC